MDRVLVLNADYTPLNLTTQTKGFKLVYKGKAEILKSHDAPILAGYQKFLRPLIIRLLNYVRYRAKGLKVNRARVFRRDDAQCAYCGSRKNLTLDHIIPKSKGGQNTWSNLVTCCMKCNLKKADRTPSEANMTMKVKPYEPTIFFEIVNQSIEKVWNEFKLSMGYEM